MNDDVRALLDIPLVAFVVRLIVVTAVIWLIATFTWAFTLSPVWKVAADWSGVALYVEVLVSLAAASLRLIVKDFVLSEPRW
ncbi:hypothetical protein [Halobaculum marinum]|uniref:Uncharacterized protein n=1 Tax=Halobaculum marinum TaxID=3031996 RepID=A0ABD5WS25_9EURY|nr:hypothetical protein [Halobaculum sp. DT55]